MGDGDAVITEQDLGDVLDAIGAAVGVFGVLDGAGRSGDVGIGGTNPAAEDLHASPRPGGFHHRGRHPGKARELLGHGLGIGKDRRRADHADLCPGLGKDRGPAQQHGGRDRSRENTGSHLASPSTCVLEVTPFRFRSRVVL